MRWKYFMSILSVLCLLSLSVYADDIKISVNQKLIDFDQPPIIEQDRTLVPFRAIFEALGAQVEWDGSKQQVTAYQGSDVITLNIGKYLMYKNNSRILLDVAPTIVNDRTIVPVRAVSETMGATVLWDEDSRTVFVTTGNDSGTEQSYERQVLDLVNAERAKNGLSALTWNAELADVARAHSKDMSDRGYFSHNTPEGLTPFDRIKNAGISYRAAAENIAAGQATPQAVMDGWMKSSGHRANILNPNLRELGVGYYKGSGSYKTYWTQNFIAK